MWRRPPKESDMPVDVESCRGSDSSFLQVASTTRAKRAREKCNHDECYIEAVEGGQRCPKGVCLFGGKEGPLDKGQAKCPWHDASSTGGGRSTRRRAAASRGTAK